MSMKNNNQYTYRKVSIILSVECSENGPSFMKDKYSKPIIVDKSIRLPPKAFVSKRLNYNICEKCSIVFN